VNISIKSPFPSRIKIVGLLILSALQLLVNGEVEINLIDLNHPDDEPMRISGTPNFELDNPTGVLLCAYELYNAALRS